MKILTLFLLVYLSPAFGATISKVIGVVKVNGKQVAPKSVVNDGDIVFADGERSIAVILFEDNSKTLLRNGKIKVKKTNIEEREVSLISGILALFIEPKTKKPFKVITKNASLGVRGTKFWVMEREAYSYLCVCEGQVDIQNESGVAQVLKGQDIEVKSKKSSLKVKDASMVMWDQARETFDIMDIAIGTRSRKK